MLHHHHVLTHYGIGSQVLFLRRCNYSREIPLVHFVNGGLRFSFPRLTVPTPVTPRGNKVIYLTQTFQKLNVTWFWAQVEDCSFWEALRAFCYGDGGWFFSFQDSKNRCCHPSNTYPYNPYSKYCSIITGNKWYSRTFRIFTFWDVDKSLNLWLFLQWMDTTSYPSEFVSQVPKR